MFHNFLKPDQTNYSNRKKLINWGIVIAVIGVFASFMGGLMNPEIREKLGLDSLPETQEIPEKKEIE